MKGNTNAVGNNGGRPLMYEDPQELEDKIVEYFEWVKGEYDTRKGTKTTTSKDGSITVEEFDYDFCIREKEIPSITGMAIYLGFESRQSLYDYSKKPVFSYSIKKALLRIENNYEKGLWNKSCTGVIFALKNMGWKDKSEVENTIKGSIDVDKWLNNETY